MHACAAAEAGDGNGSAAPKAYAMRAALMQDGADAAAAASSGAGARPRGGVSSHTRNAASRLEQSCADAREKFSAGQSGAPTTPAAGALWLRALLTGLWRDPESFFEDVGCRYGPGGWLAAQASPVTKVRGPCCKASNRVPPHRSGWCHGGGHVHAHRVRP